MSLKGNTVELQIWNFLKDKGLTDCGAAGLMGNLRAESGLSATNMQNSYEKKFNYTDQTYTQSVDNGNYTNFIRDAVGYGLAQWTYWSRKKALLEYVKGKGKSIGDLESQLEFLFQELSTKYKSVLSALKTADSVQSASNTVLKDFENPNNQSTSVQTKRAEYGQVFFDKYAQKQGGNDMALKVGSARIDENGKATGGAAGDQTGNEVSTQNYYVHSKGWYVLRPKSATVANTLAEAMFEACANDNIGYDQSNRTDVISKLKKYGSMAKITEKTEADCGTLVRGCCIVAGFDPGNFTTANEATKLAATNMFEEKKSVTSTTELFNGDILVTKTKGHTVIVVSGNPREGSAGNSTSVVSSAKIDSAKSKDSSISGTYETTAKLNLRSGAGTSKSIVTVIPKGENVKNYGFYTTISGTKWYLVSYGNEATGFCSSKYLKKV